MPVTASFSITSLQLNKDDCTYFTPQQNGRFYEATGEVGSHMKTQLIFPLMMIALNFGAAVAAGYQRDYRRALYFLASGLCPRGVLGPAVGPNDL